MDTALGIGVVVGSIIALIAGGAVFLSAARREARWREAAIGLFRLLDDLEGFGVAIGSDDATFRSHADNICACRHAYLDTDGLHVDLHVDDSASGARPRTVYRKLPVAETGELDLMGR